MTRTLAAFPKGHEFAPVSFNLTPDLVRAYVEAVEDSAIASIPGAVPPMALAALSVRSLLDAAALPDGSIHVGQELSFLRAVKEGDDVTVHAKVVSRGERAGWVLMGVDLSVDADGGTAMQGRATITFPVEPAR